MTLEPKIPVASSGGRKPALHAQQTVAAQVLVLEPAPGVQGGGAGLWPLNYVSVELCAPPLGAFRLCGHFVPSES